MSPLQESDIVPLVRADMKRAESAMRRELDRALFQSDPLLARISVRSIPRWKRQWWAVRGYLSTLGKALRGIDLVEPSEYDE